MSDLIVIHTKNRNGRAYGRSLRLPPKEVKLHSYLGWFVHAGLFRLKLMSTPQSIPSSGPRCTSQPAGPKWTALGLQFLAALPIPLLENRSNRSVREASSSF